MIFKIITLLLIMFPLIILAEIGLRWRKNSFFENNQHWQTQATIHKKSDDEKLIYELTPGGGGVRQDVYIKINSTGFRDDEFPEEFPQESKRIVLLGDSIAWGWGVPMEQAFPQLIERRLRELIPVGEDPPIIYNFAVDGYSTEQEVRMLETRGLALQPDLIILNYVLNDPDINDGGLADYFKRNPRIELLHLVHSAIGRIKHMLKLKKTHGEYIEYHQYIHTYYRDQIQEQFQMLGRISQETGVPIVVAVMPLFKFKLGNGYPWQNLHDLIEQLCKENGLDFIDLYKSFQGLNPEDVSFDILHPNAKGHNIVAETIVGYLRNYLWEKPE